MSEFNTKKKFYKDSDVMFDYTIVNRSINTENNLRTKYLKDKKKVNKAKNKRLTSYGNFTAGRGFGNLDANNNIRYGFNSREDKQDFATKREGKLNNRFDFLFDDKKQQVHGNISFNLSGESTRSQQLTSDSIFKYKKTDFFKEQSDDKSVDKSEPVGFNFKY